MFNAKGIEQETNFVVLQTCASCSNVTPKSTIFHCSHHVSLLPLLDHKHFHYYKYETDHIQKIVKQDHRCPGNEPKENSVRFAVKTLFNSISKAISSRFAERDCKH
jgi:hypothetical protein